MKVDFKGLKFKNWAYLMIYSALILIVLWVLQFLFLNTFYMTMKTHEVVKVGEQVVETYKGSNFNNMISEYAFKNNLRIMLLDQTGNISNGRDGFGAPIEEAGERFQKPIFQRIEREFKTTDEDHIYFSETDEGGGMSQITYVAKVVDSQGQLQYLCVVSPVPPIDSTTTVLKTQFVIIAVIIFLLSIVAGQLISRKMSKPIIKLTQSAEKLAKGDMKVSFEGGGYTEIYQLASTLQYATKELSKLDGYQKELIANISHDLKTPLTIIRMYAEMISEIGENPEKREEYSQKIIKESEWLAVMVNEILELSKLESRTEQIVMEDVDLSLCLKETLSSFKVLSNTEGYVFKIDMDEDITVKGSKAYYRRVFYNLISNAINYSGEEKTVEIRLKNLEDRVSFRVTDFGDGIPLEDVDSIWERYYKSKEVHKRAVVGTGLGLSIVKHSLELLGVRYGVTSEVGRGSTFWFEVDK